MADKFFAFFSSSPFKMNEFSRPLPAFIFFRSRLIRSSEQLKMSKIKGRLPRLQKFLIKDENERLIPAINLPGLFDPAAPHLFNLPAIFRPASEKDRSSIKEQKFRQPQMAGFSHSHPESGDSTSEFSNSGLEPPDSTLESACTNRESAGSVAEFEDSGSVAGDSGSVSPDSVAERAISGLESINLSFSGRREGFSNHRTRPFFAKYRKNRS